jgi:HEAT repeat protein
LRSRRSTKSLALGLCIFCADALQAAEPEKLDTATDPRAPINARLAALQSSGKSDPAQRGKILPVLTELVLTDEQSAVRIGAIKALETLGWGEDSRTLGALVLARESGGEELRFRLKPGAASTRALTPAQMARKESFDRMWDFDSIWKLEQGDIAPSLCPDPVSPEKIATGGTGTASDPFLIATSEQLDAMRNRLGPDVHFRQVADIDLKDFGNPKSGWVPIRGTIGSYDGGGYRILNLTINLPRRSDVGLFGKLVLSKGGSLRRVALENVNVTGRSRVGGLVGSVGEPKKTARLENCYVTGTVSGHDLVGGIAGQVFGYHVSNCYSSAAIRAEGAEAAPLVARAWWNASLKQGFHDADKSGLDTEPVVALRALRKHHPGLETRLVLYELLKSDDALLRTRASSLAAVLQPDPQGLKSGMVAALMDDRYDVRRQARRVADAYGDAAKAVMVSVLADGYAKPAEVVVERVRIARAAGELAVEPSVNLLINMLADRDGEVRGQAIASLRFMGIPYLEQAPLDPPCPWWNARAEWKARAVAALERVVTEDPEQGIQADARLALARIRGGGNPEPSVATQLLPKITLATDLPVAERALLEKAYAEVDACRQTAIGKYGEELAWPFRSASKMFHSSANLHRNRNLEVANRYLMESIGLPVYGSEAGGLVAPEWPLTYGLYHSRSAHFPGRLSAEAEALFKESMFTFLEWKSRESFAKYIDQVWQLAGTENHHITFGPILWYLYLGYLAEDPTYASRQLVDGLTVTQWCGRWRTYTKEWLKGRALNGIFVEMGAGYMKYSLPGLFALYSGAEDPEIRKLAGMFLDLYFIDEIQFSYDFLRSGNKSRASAKPDTPIAHILKPLYGEGVQFPGHFGQHAAVTSGYRPPPEALLLRRQYQHPEKPIIIANRRLGEEGDGVTLTPDSRILNYGYKTRHFLIGSALRPPGLPCSALFNQAPFNGLIFANGGGLYPEPETFGRCSDPYESFQHEAVLIFRKNKGAYRTGAMRVQVKPETRRVEKNGWIFVHNGPAYCAIRVLDGGHHWSEDKRYLLPDEDLSPILMQAGDVDRYGSFDSFMAAIAANTLTWNGKKLEYKGPNQLHIEFFTRETGETPRVHGKDFDFQPALAYDSPYMRREANSSIVTVTVGPHVTDYDFEAVSIKRTVKKEESR